MVKSHSKLKCTICQTSLKALIKVFVYSPLKMSTSFIVYLSPFLKSIRTPYSKRNTITSFAQYDTSGSSKKKKYYTLIRALIEIKQEAE